MSKYLSIKWRNDKQGWGLVSQSLHWLIGIAIIGLMISGIIMENMDNSPQKFELYGLHKAIGSLTLIFIIIRFLWRISNIRPAWPNHMAIWKKTLAKVSHSLLYVLMFIQPASGILMSQAKGYPVSLFGLFNLPAFISPSENVARIASSIHESGWLVLAAIVGLHIIGAFHHLLRKDGIFGRMIPGVKAQKY